MARGAQTSARGAALAASEAMPEADCLDGFPHPRETAAVFGHARAEEAFAAALSSGHLHHAWLLAGPSGTGKATLAYRFARAALAADDERDLLAGPLDVARDSATARQIAQQSHPGLLVLRRPWDSKTKKFATTIPIDAVRRVKTFLSLTAEGNGRRIVLVDSADELNINSANALLKSLEEPPPRALFFIVTSAPGRLLPTIRSRCRLLSLDALDDAAMRNAVSGAMRAAEKDEPDAALWPDLLRLAGGSVRQALACLDGDGLELQAAIDKLIGSLPKLNAQAVHVLADRLQPAGAEQRFNLFLDLFFATLHRLAHAAATGKGRPSDVALGDGLAGSGRLATLAELWETLARDRADTARLNLDRKALILRSFAGLEAVFASS